MKCVNHPEVDAVGACVKCGKGICIDCKRELGINFYCQSCAHEMLIQKPAPSTTVADGKKSKILGIRLLVFGVIGCVLAFLSVLLAFGMGGNDDPKPGTGIMIFIAMALSVISPILFITGLTRVVTGATGISLAALVCGILSLLFIRISLLVPISLLLGLLAIILGAVSLSKLKKTPSQSRRKIAIAGIILGIIGVVAYGIWSLVFWWH